jgi:5-methylcytosine-specific restriction endonuclease McrA
MRQTPLQKGPGNPIPSAIRKQVADRDKGHCRWCGAAQGLHQHHVDYRSEGGGHTEYNLLSLCHVCHAKAHSNKRLYQPLLRAVVWMHYVTGRTGITASAVNRILKAMNDDGEA